MEVVVAAVNKGRVSRVTVMVGGADGGCGGGNTGKEAKKERRN